tara:strand:- start:537 stop:734 length:198 start_codon:yes stop_codon:yes gene_type:complete
MSNLNFSKGVKRIYYVLSTIWILFIFIIAGEDWNDVPIIILAVGLIPPIIIYYVLGFIIAGFKDK